MLEVNYDSVRYARLLTNSVGVDVTKQLKENFDYIFIVSYDERIEDNSFEILNKNACLFDASLTEDELVQKFNSTGRNEYRRTYRTEGLDFHFGISDIDSYYIFYSTCEHARSWYPVPKIELQRCLIFTASFQGEFISGMSCYTGNDTIRVSRIYSNKRINSNPQVNGTMYGGAAKRLVVEICKYAKNHGLKWVDLGGVDLSSNEKSGISEFKKSLGGHIVPVKIGRYMTPEFIQKQKEYLEKGIDIT
jgi:hypothetical protein